MDRRLQSIKHPRDLTLGGSKPKKVFLPNINATRNKEKKEYFIIKTEGQKKTNNKTNLRNSKKGFDRSEKFIQSSGIFSDGVGSDALKKVRYERAYIPKDDTTTIPVIFPKVKTNWQIDNKSETDIYEDVTDHSESADEKEKIAFRSRTWNESDLKEKKVLKSNKKNIKSEPMSRKPDLANLKTEFNKIPQEFNEVDNVDNLKPGLSLWKLPDSFCGKGLSDDPNVQTLFDYKLTDLLEGQVGKMRIHKSGKIDVKIGRIKYQIEASQLDTCTEKIVALDTKKDSVSCIVLGHVHNRCMLNPDWASLLKNL